MAARLEPLPVKDGKRTSKVDNTVGDRPSSAPPPLPRPAAAIVGLPARRKRLTKKQREDLLRAKREREIRERQELLRAEKDAEECQRAENGRRDAHLAREEADVNHQTHLVESLAEKEGALLVIQAKLSEEAKQHGKQLDTMQHMYQQQQAENSQLRDRVRELEKDAEDRFLLIQRLQDQLTTVEGQMSIVKKEADVQNEHLSEVSTTLNNQLSVTEMENRVLRIERRNQEADFHCMVRDLQNEWSAKLDLLLARHEELSMEQKQTAVSGFLHAFDDREDQYKALIQLGKEKVKSLHEFFFQLQPLHSNVPPMMRVQLEALTKQQLFLLLDVLCCYEPVMSFLRSKFPPEGRPTVI